MEKDKRNESILTHVRSKLQYDFPQIRVKDLLVSQMKQHQQIIIDMNRVDPLYGEEQEKFEKDLLLRLREIFAGFSIHRSQFSPKGPIKIVLQKKVFDATA